MLVSMDKNDWKNIVRGIAPALGTALVGPAAGAAVAAIGGLLLGDKTASEDVVAAAVRTASPDMLLLLRKEDNAFAIRMQELGVDVYKTEVADRVSAREAGAKADFKPQIALSIVFIGGYFVAVVPIIYGLVPSPDNVLFAAIIGVITANMASIMQFWFGSSSGSKDKTAKL